MISSESTRRIVGITLFGWILIIYGISTISFLILNYHKTYEQLGNVLSMAILIIPEVNRFFLYSRIFTFSVYLMGITFGFIYLICGIGILRLRAWARYVLIALMISWIISIPNKVLFFGWQSLNIPEVLIGIIIPSFILWFFLRKVVKSQFLRGGVRFSLKSNYGLLILYIIFVALLPLLSLLTLKTYLSLRYKEPFFSIKPELIKLKEIDETHFSDKYRRIELFDTSIIIPENFIILYFTRLSLGGYNCIVGDSVGKSLIILSNTDNIYENYRKIFKQMQFKNAYNFERALYTNSWNFMLIVLRKVEELFGGDYKLEEFDSPKIKGFMRYRYNREKGEWWYLCSLYSRDNRLYRKITFVSNERKITNNILNIISSLNFLSEGQEKAEEYFNQGLEALKRGDSITAQFKLANAYYLSPEIPEYGYFLAKVLFMNRKRSSAASAKRLLEDVLRIRPNYREAKELLKMVRNAPPSFYFK